MHRHGNRAVRWRHAKHDTWTDGRQSSLRTCHRSAAREEEQQRNAQTHTHTQSHVRSVSTITERLHFVCIESVHKVSERHVKYVYIFTVKTRVPLKKKKKEGGIILSPFTNKSKFIKYTVWSISISLKSSIWIHFIRSNYDWFLLVQNVCGTDGRLWSLHKCCGLPACESEALHYRRERWLEWANKLPKATTSA